MLIPPHIIKRPFIPLGTQRLYFEPLWKAKPEELVSISRDVEVSQYTRIPHPYHEQDAISYLEKVKEAFFAGNGLVLAIRNLQTKKLMGSIGVMEELGYMLGKDYWGQGYMTEALGTILPFFFNSLKVSSLYASADPRNEISLKLLKKFRFTPEDEGFSLTREAFFSHHEKLPLMWVVGGALVSKEGKLLMTSRPKHKPFAGLWELPGGKMEEGETPEEALVRELQEEIGVQADPNALEPLSFASHRYERFHMIMMIFLCKEWQGIPHSVEGQDLAWIGYDDISNYPTHGADIEIAHHFFETLSIQCPSFKTH